MNYNEDWGSRGANIIPSARPSIHNHESCIFASSAVLSSMGRFGVGDGVDEVDNVLSKPSEPISPLMFEKCRNSPSAQNSSGRRNSLIENKNYTDDDTNLLSKSTPATLPSQLRYSDYFNVEREKTPSHNRHLNESFHSTNRSPVVNKNPSVSNGSLLKESIRESAQNSSGRRNSLIENKNYTNDDTDDSDDEREKTPSHNRHLNESFYSTNRSPVVNRNRSGSNGSLLNESIRESSQGMSSQIIKLALPVVVVLLGSMYMNLNTNEGNKVVYDEYMFYSDIIDLGHKYKVDENNVLKVQTGISTIFKRQDVGSFMFVYDSDKEYFNKSSFNTFMNEVSFTVSKYLRNDSIPLNYIIIEGKDLNMEEHSEVMCKFREDLHKSGVMLVKDIEAIPSSLAMAFHYFCDEYNPLVKKSAIFFTIDLAKCLLKETKSAKYVVIEHCLANKWKSIPPDSIGPLLARVVSVIIDVTSVF